MRFRELVPAAAVLLVILVATTIPGHWRDALVRNFPPSIHPTDLGHFLMFAAFSVCLCVARRDIAWPVVLGAALLVGCATEALQFLAIDRTPSVLDVAVDVVGALAGFVATRSLARMGVRKPVERHRGV